MALEKAPAKGYKFFKVPNYPDVPYEEYKSRITKAQKLMSENGVDCLVLWNRKNIRYFYGYQTTHWEIPSLQPGVGIIPKDGDPIIIVPDFFRGNAECLCWVRDIRCLIKPHHVDNTRGLPLDVAEVVKEIGYGDKKIGLEMGHLGCFYIPRPLNDIDAFRKALPEAQFVDSDKVIWGCRMIKSPLEIERIRKSCEAQKIIVQAVVEEFRPGMTEIDLGIIAQRKAAELGTGHLGDSCGLGGSFRAAYDKEPMADMGVHEGAIISRNDYIFIDIYYMYKGYMPDNSTRMIQVGPISDRTKWMYDLTFKCQDAAVEVLKAGVPVKDVYNAMYEPIMKEGLPGLDCGGHGTGLDQQEPPNIDCDNEMLLEEGMVLSIEPWVYENYKMHGGEGKFGVQDQFVITENGCEEIWGYDRNVMQVAHPFE